MRQEKILKKKAGLDEAIKLQDQQDEEVAKQIHLDKMIAKRMAEEEDLTEQQKKRKAQVQFKAQFYTQEDWDAIRSKLKANTELSKDNQGTWKLSQLKKLKFKEIKEEFDKFDDKDVPAIGDKVAKVKEEEPVKRTGKRKKQKARKAMIKDFTREDLIELYRLVMQKYGTNRPKNVYDRVLWSDLRTMFVPPLIEDVIWSLPLQQKMGSFDVIVGMDWFSKRKFVIVCHEKVVRIPLEGEEILRVHGEHTQRVVKTLMNTKAPAEMLRDLDQQMEKRADDGKANVVTDALSRKERVKPRRVRAMAMIIQYGVRGMILAAQSEAFKQENETTDKVVVIKERLQAARDRQKSYADNRRKPLEFEVGDRVMLKVSPWKGVVRFGKKGKLAPRYVGPFEILERIGPVAYRLRLPEELSGVHDTFHVSTLKKCLADTSLHVPLNEIKVDKTLRFIEEPAEILDREVKSLKRSKISLVKVRWDSKRGPEFTWEREDFMKSKYPQLFVDRADESAN
ncbi:hypothetical protein Tco_0958616 [Tanacetum coccineum]